MRRSRKPSMPSSGNPTPAEIKRKRLSAGLSRKEAGELIGVAYRTWQDWELGTAKMRPQLWELFQMKVKARRGP
jgi:DNA-binding transcriptional regulator YiaG